MFIFVKDFHSECHYNQPLTLTLRQGLYWRHVHCQTTLETGWCDAADPASLRCDRASQAVPCGRERLSLLRGGVPAAAATDPVLSRVGNAAGRHQEDHGTP